MKKIFVEGSLFNKEEQGSLTYLRELYKIITLNSKENSFIFGTDNPSVVKKIFGNHKNVFYYKYFFANKFLRLFIETPYVLCKKKIDFAHFQYITPLIKPLKCKYIVTIHDVLFIDYKADFSFSYRLIRTILFYLSSKISDLTLTVSNYSKERISNYFSIDLNKIKVTPNAVSEDFINFKATKKESNLHLENFNIYNDFVLYVSRIEPRKNQLLLLDLFEEKIIEDDLFTIVFVGASTISSAFKKQFAFFKKKYPKNIFHFEALAFSDLIHFYNSAKLFIYPSKCEGFGIPPLEAGVLRTPVLCSNLTAMKDFDFFNPLMFDPQSENIINVYNNLILSNDLPNQEKIRKKIIKKYNWENSASILINYFNNL